MLSLVFCTFVQAFKLRSPSNSIGSTATKTIQLDNSPPEVSHVGGKLPIVVPPASGILEYRKKLVKDRSKHMRKQSQIVNPKESKNILLKSVPILPVTKHDWSFPTKSEFLRLLKTHPADARQLMERHDIDVSSISPIRQLPSGKRQLPDDTRQRPSSTW